MRSTRCLVPCGLAFFMSLVLVLFSSEVRAGGMVISTTPNDAALCPLGSLSFDVELDDLGATIVERRTYPVPVIVDESGRRLVRFYKPVQRAGGVVDSVTVDGVPRTGRLLEPGLADPLRRALVLELSDPAPLREVRTPLWVMDPVEMDPQQTSVEIEVRWRTDLHRQGTLTGFSAPVDWHPNPAADVVLDVRASTELPFRALYSPYHQLEVVRSENRATGSYSGNGVATAHDVTVLISSGSEPVRFDLLPFRYGDDEGGFFMALLSTELAPPEEEIVARDLVVTLDVSGSMDGEKIIQARNALSQVLSGLRADDRFNVVTFSDNVDSFRPAAVEASFEALEDAGNFVSRVVADGATDIDQALTRSFASLPSKRGAPQYVVLITDGQPTAGETEIDQIVANAERNNERGARIFTFGIGHDVNTVLLDKLAESSSGDALYIEPGESVQQIVEEFFGQIQTPIVADPTIDFGDFGVSDVYPASLQDLFAGSTVAIAGRYASPGSSTIALRGVTGGKDTQLSFDVQLPEFDLSSSFAPAVWATRHIGTLLENVKLGNDDPALVSSALAAASRYGIVSRFTFFDVDEAGNTRMEFGTVSQAAVGADAVGTSSALDEQTKEESVQAFASADVRAILDRSLPLQDGYFTDSSLPRTTQWVDVHFGSELFFELAFAESDYGAASILSTAPNLRFELLGRLFRVTDEASGLPMPPESARIPAPTYTPVSATPTEVQASDATPLAAGCACRAAPRPRAGFAAAFLSLLAVGAVRRRRRPASRS